MPNLDSQSNLEDVEARREEEVHLSSSSAVQIPGSPPGHRGSSTKLDSTPPPVLIHGWLLSLSHYIAVYSMLITRFGTRCDCRKLRAKSEVVRHRSVDYARKCQESLLPIVDKVGVSLLGLPSGSMNMNLDSTRLSHRRSCKANLEDYYRLFFLHCTCLEFFTTQLLRTAQLFQCFSLNIGRSLTSSLIAPPPNFIYSGLAEVERPRKKRNQLLERRSRDVLVNDSLSGIELDLASRVSYGQTPSGDHDNHSSDLPHPVATVSRTHSYLQESQPSRIAGRIKSFGSLYCKTTPVNMPPSPSKHPSLKLVNEERRKVSSSATTSHGDHKRRNVETDIECFEKLLEDIRVVHGMIREIQANVPLHPWKRRRLQRSKSQEENDEGSLEDLDYIDGEDEDSDNADEVGELDIGQEIQRIPISSQHFYTNSRLQRWRRHWRNVRLMRSMKRKRLRRGSPEYEEKYREDDETILSKRTRRRQYMCLSCIIAISIGLCGSALGSCIYLLT
ncbi:hypothetical protein Aperf_G00000075552 [Anoplocephala perfoliata]